MTKFARMIRFGHVTKQLQANDLSTEYWSDRRAWWQNLQTSMVTEPTDDHGDRTYRRAWWENLQTSMVTEPTDEHGDRTYRRAWWQNLQTSMVTEPTDEHGDRTYSRSVLRQRHGKYWSQELCIHLFILHNGRVPQSNVNYVLYHKILYYSGKLI